MTRSKGLHLILFLLCWTAISLILSWSAEHREAGPAEKESAPSYNAALHQLLVAENVVGSVRRGFTLQGQDLKDHDERLKARDACTKTRGLPSGLLPVDHGPRALTIEGVSVPMSLALAREAMTGEEIKVGYPSAMASGGGPPITGPGGSLKVGTLSAVFDRKYKIGRVDGHQLESDGALLLKKGAAPQVAEAALGPPASAHAGEVSSSATWT